MLITSAGRLMLVKELQSRNAELPMLVMLFGNLILFMKEQFSKALLAMPVIGLPLYFDGITSSVSIRSCNPIIEHVSPSSFI